MKKAKFTIDDTAQYEGYTDGTKWNGWECPMFTKEVADYILRDKHLDSVKWFNAANGYLVHSDSDYCISTMSINKLLLMAVDGKTRDDLTLIEGIEFEGQQLYAITDGACWDMVDDDLSDAEIEINDLLIEVLRPTYVPGQSTTSLKNEANKFVTILSTAQIDMLEWSLTDLVTIDRIIKSDGKILSDDVYRYIRNQWDVTDKPILDVMKSANEFLERFNMNDFTNYIRFAEALRREFYYQWVSIAMNE